MDNKLIEYNKVNQVILTYNKRFFVFGMIIFMLFIFSIGIFYLSYQHLTAPVKPPEGSIEEKIKYHRETYQKFSEMSEDELYIIWRKLLKTCRYEKNGNYQQNKIDCSGAIFIVLNFLGSNLPSENVNSLEKRIKKLAYEFPEMIRRNKKTIMPKDLILLESPKGDRHVGIVYAVRGAYIQYMDFNIRTRESRSTVWIKSKKISCISHISLPLWMGDLL